MINYMVEEEAAMMISREALEQTTLTVETVLMKFWTLVQSNVVLKKTSSWVILICVELIL